MEIIYIYQAKVYTIGREFQFWFCWQGEHVNLQFKTLSPSTNLSFVIPSLFSHSILKIR
jgi:membrane-associated PAP2 superfamily phosphatase